jgi:hypothetical protein
MAEIVGAACIEQREGVRRWNRFSWEWIRATVRGGHWRSRWNWRRSARDTWAITVAHVINWSRYSFPTHEDAEMRPVQRRAEIEAARAEVIDRHISWAEAETSVETSRS